MKKGLYSTLAIDGMKKNRQLYIPYLITAVMMVAMHYIMLYIAKSGVTGNMAGGSSMSQILNLGSYLVSIFSAVFLFYTNSFLIRRRKKEFGLFNILGMTKKNIAKIMAREICFSWMAAMVAGLGTGIILSKIAELGLRNLVQRDVNYSFTISIEALLRTVIFFSIIFLLLFLYSLIQLKATNAVGLLSSEKNGEKAPKANWIIGIAGLLVLAAGYGICIAIRQPLSALMWFFVAVILAVGGIFLVFIAGSVLLCKILQKNKKYYYKANHFVSVSSMTYRMKRNGAGLASICILLTMVLVMISSSSCLYFNADDCLTTRYPCQIDTCVSRYGYDSDNSERAQKYKHVVDTEASKRDIKLTKEYCHYEYSITGLLENGRIDISLNSQTNQAFIDYEKVADAVFIDVDDYNSMYGKNERLKPGEALCCAIRTDKISGEFTVGRTDFNIVGELDKKIIDDDNASRASVSPTIYLVVPDIDKTAEAFAEYKDYDGTPMLCWLWSDRFDTNAGKKEQKTLASAINGKLFAASKTDKTHKCFCVSRSGVSFDYYDTFGALFFIGIMLSVIFLVACVIIMYFKQISEGYEDQSRFDIMQKVGMTKKMIRKSINSQMITVFMLPIGLAVLNIIFVFPMISKILMLFGLFNMVHLVITAAVSVLVCTAFYTIVYKVTSNTYYRIVS